MQEHSFHKEGSDLGGSPEGRTDDTSGQATLGKPIRTEQMEADHRDKTIQSFAQNVLRLGNECRALAEENTRLKAEVERLRASSFVTAVPVEQYERVIKVGDEMASLFGGDFSDIDGVCYDKKWNAAKEGKPSV